MLPCPKTAAYQLHITQPNQRPPPHPLRNSIYAYTVSIPVNKQSHFIGVIWGL